MRVLSVRGPNHTAMKTRSSQHRRTKDNKPRTTCALSRFPSFFAAMNRIVQRFDQLRATGRKGFVAYIGAGDPHLSATHDLALAFDAVGVDILELGVPF